MMTSNSLATGSTTSANNNYVNMMSSPQAVEIGQTMKQTAREVQNEVQQGGDFSLRLMTLIAGLAMMIVSISGFLTKIVTFGWTSAAMDIIIFIIGFAFVLLESGLIKLGMFSSTDTIINEKAPFLRSLGGRGTVFVVVGLLELFYMGGLFDVLVGCVCCYVGVMHFVTRHKATAKVNKAREAVMSSNAARGSMGGMEVVQEQFAMCDVDGQGGLTLDQFQQFANNLGLALNKRESEAAFMQIDKDHNGRLSYEEIQKWWTKDQKV